MVWRTWGYYTIQVDLEGLLVIFGEGRRTRENHSGEVVCHVQRKTKRRMNVTYACESEEKEITELRLVLQSHVGNWTVKVILD